MVAASVPPTAATDDMPAVAVAVTRISGLGTGTSIPIKGTSTLCTSANTSSGKSGISGRSGRSGALGKSG